VGGGWGGDFHRRKRVALGRAALLQFGREYVMLSNLSCQVVIFVGVTLGAAGT
jgi:hypothetical protein